MARNNWQQALESLVTRSSRSERGSGSELTAALSGGSAGAERPVEAGSGGNAGALTERVPPGTAGDLRGPLISLREKLSELIRVSQSQVRTLEDNTAALARSGSLRAADAVKSATSSMGGFSGLSTTSPLVSGIAKLLGKSKPEAPPPVTPYGWPSPLRIDAGIGGGRGNGGVSYDANGTPRLEAAADSVPASQINIHVQAIDSRSFLDHSGEIARAVRAAMLESHVLRDVVSEF